MKAYARLARADIVTLDCARQAAGQEVTTVDMAREEYTVTAMH